MKFIFRCEHDPEINKSKMLMKDAKDFIKYTNHDSNILFKLAAW